MIGSEQDKRRGAFRLFRTSDELCELACDLLEKDSEKSEFKRFCEEHEVSGQKRHHGLAGSLLRRRLP